MQIIENIRMNQNISLIFHFTFYLLDTYYREKVEEKTFVKK